MTALDKFREQVKIATDAQVERGNVHYVTMTADEATALLDEVACPICAARTARPGPWLGGGELVSLPADDEVV